MSNERFLFSLFNWWPILCSSYRNVSHSVHWGINPPQQDHPPLSCQAPLPYICKLSKPPF